MIPVVRTIGGDLPPSGIHGVLSQDRLIRGGQIVRPNRSDLSEGDDLWGFAVRYLRGFRALGVDLVADCTASGLGRDLGMLCELSNAADIAIVCATGFPPARWLPSPEVIGGVKDASEHMVQELSSGFIDEDGWGRAGMIHLGISKPRIHPREEELLRAAAQAAGLTGALVMVDVGLTGSCNEVIRIFERSGGDLSRLAVMQMGSEADHSGLVEDSLRGVYVGLGGIGKRPDNFYLGRIQKFGLAGCLDRVLLTHAYPRDDSRTATGSYCAGVHSRFQRALADAGFTRDEVRKFMRDNALRTLSLA